MQYIFTTQTDRQTIGHGQRIYLQLTRKYHIVRSTQFGWYSSHVMSISRHVYFAVINYAQRDKYIKPHL